MTQIDKAEALLPCPFCGGEAELWNAHDNRPAWIACMGRCAVLVSKEHTTDAEAIAAWNRRAALPARGVGVKPLVWEAGERDQRRAESILGEFCVTFFGGRWFYQGEPRKGMLDAQAAAQADYEARILAALAPSPEVVKELVEAAKALNGIIEGIQGAMEHGTWRDEKGQRLKDTPEWVAFYNARAALAKLEAWE